MQITCINN